MLLGLALVDLKVWMNDLIYSILFRASSLWVSDKINSKSLMICDKNKIFKKGRKYILPAGADL
jgi:hypothetical protein